MPTNSEKKLLSNGEVIKLITAVVVASSIWFRMEQKFDQNSERILKKIDEHMLSDKFEKQIMSNEIAILRAEIKEVKSDLNTAKQKSEFVRPSQIEVPEPETREIKKK